MGRRFDPYEIDRINALHEAEAARRWHAQAEANRQKITQENMEFGGSIGEPLTSPLLLL